MQGVDPQVPPAARAVGTTADPPPALPYMTFNCIPYAPVDGQLMGGPNDEGGYTHITAIQAPPRPLPILMPDPVNDATPRLDPVVAAALNKRPTVPIEPQIDPALLMLSHQLPTPRHSVTPRPTAAADTTARPRPRPKVGAAADGIVGGLQAGGSGSTDTLAAVMVTRKRTNNSDKLAADEALRIGSTSGKRQRRPAARKLGIAP